MAVRRIDDEEIDPRVDECVGTLARVFSNSYGSTDNEPAARILRGVRVSVGLDEVLHGEEPAQSTFSVDEGQLLDLAGCEEREGLIGVNALACGDERHSRHDLGGRLAHVVLKAHVAIRDDADEDAVGVDDRHARDSIPAAEPVDMRKSVGRQAGDRVGDHARL